MSKPDFWHNVLEQDETLLWVGKPEPRVHGRNWQLFGAPLFGAVCLLGTGWFILSKLGTQTDMWLMVFLAVAAVVPANVSRRQLKNYATTRYALTDRHALFFDIKAEGTRVKSYPVDAFIPPKVRKTSPPSIGFLGEHGGARRIVSFDYITRSDELLDHLEGHPK